MISRLAPKIKTRQTRYRNAENRQSKFNKSHVGGFRSLDPHKEVLDIYSKEQFKSHIRLRTKFLLTMLRKYKTKLKEECKNDKKVCKMVKINKDKIVGVAPTNVNLFNLATKEFKRSQLHSRARGKLKATKRLEAVKELISLLKRKELSYDDMKLVKKLNNFKTLQTYIQLIIGLCNNPSEVKRFQLEKELTKIQTNINRKNHEINVNNSVSFHVPKLISVTRNSKLQDSAGLSIHSRRYHNHNLSTSISYYQVS